MHENGLRISAFDREILLHTNVWYSTGGGFVVDEAHFGQQASPVVDVPFAFCSAKMLLNHCKENGLSLPAVMMKNEQALHGNQALETFVTGVWETMKNSIQRGISTEGLLPGPLKVQRRASALYRLLDATTQNANDPMNAMDWLNMFAMAVSEENAAGGRVVTAPTNGACGIVPAVLAWYDRFIHPVNGLICLRYFLAAGAMAILYKTNASISGAEVGCQGEVGVACSMAAAGMAELMGGSSEQGKRTI